MIQQKGRVPTPEASRYLQRLCYHFSKKITVAYDEHQGQADFPWGRCLLNADAEALHFDCTAEDAELLARVRYALDEHIKLFSRKAPMVAVWEDAVARPDPD